MRALRIASVVELASLVVLLANLFTVHVEEISTLVGPLHGTAYLAVMAISFLIPASAAARWRTAIPGIGGLLAVRKLRGGPPPQRGGGPDPRRVPDP
ncbi:DUF3817 domain-containing protein [Saccharopolyspora taberi]